MSPVLQSRGSCITFKQEGALALNREEGALLQVQRIQWNLEIQDF